MAVRRTARDWDDSVEAETPLQHSPAIIGEA